MEFLQCTHCGRDLESPKTDGEALCSDCRKILDTEDSGSSVSISSTPPSLTKSPWQCPVTLSLVAANLAVFLLMRFTSSVHSRDQLLRWGADWGPLTFSGQWWRILTSMFIHDGWDHLTSNMLGLWIIGRTIEERFSRSAFLLIYLFSGCAGAVLGLAIRPEVLHCGASGAILGILGIALAQRFFVKSPARAARFGKRMWLLLLLMAYSVWSPSSHNTASNEAHVGGLIAGFGLWFFLSREKKDKPLFPSRVFVLAGTFLILLLALTRYENGWIIPLRYANEAFEANKFAEASRQVNLILDTHPNDITANLMMGAVSIQLADYQKAEASLKRVLAVRPHDASAEYFLGVVYLHTGRFDDALTCVDHLFARGSMGFDEQKLFAAAEDGKGEHALAGEWYLKLHLYEEARHSLESALQSNPRDEESKSRLIQALEGLGMRDKADAIRNPVSSTK